MTETMNWKKQMDSELSELNAHNWKRHFDVTPWQTLVAALVLGFLVVALVLQAIVAKQLHDENLRLKQQTQQKP